MSLIQFVKSKTFLVQIAIAAVGLVLFAFGVMKWLDISTNHDQKIEVPNLEKMSLHKVKTTLEDLDLNFVVLDSASYNPNFPPKSVIEQSPEPGNFVKENRKIYLTLNPASYKNVKIPNLFGRTKRQATSQLRAIGFRISSNEIYVSDIAKDVVRGLLFNGKNLKAGDKIPKNSSITLKLGDGNGSGRYSEKTSEEN
ncbi:PASTA domain-containing protein [Lutibacter oricola]|uniref:PASTA domain-containing protein n=1 Tax=Lutibacter oricola TaxID=762486 RepID=A0A1H2ZF98_9FLAO|nr:PASTA domain-containing protein [Lutibacter oricola]SDX16163.1 PASTA domain-containing protein [Lutibacter oricola]